MDLRELLTWLELERGTTRWSRAPFLWEFSTDRALFNVRVYGDARMAWAADVEGATQFFEGVMGARCNHSPLRLSVVFVPLLTAPKRFPPGRCVLNRTDVNSGMTERRGGETTIYVYRTHEIQKVYFHELLHAGGAFQEPPPSMDYFGESVARGYAAALERHPWLRVVEVQNGGWLMIEAVTEALACALKLLYDSGGGSMYRSACARDREHAATVSRRFLEWGDACWRIGRVARVRTPAVEYYVFKDLLYAWAQTCVIRGARTPASASRRRT